MKQKFALQLHTLRKEFEQKSGIAPMSFIKQYPNRIPYIHIKDMTRGDNAEFTEIGTGSIDFKPILEWGEKHGIEGYVVEQDQCKGSAMDSVAISYSQSIRLSRDLSWVDDMKEEDRWANPIS
ncbi:hypothetical protein [Bacillus sp. 3255]|uniref:sugar phosphate isomerase/epimerase family protein n=1 Tax=Bacillus sp. 3255 TaxID=2817904 RepID=UPI0028567B5E|nr:hypothetical protein [Bacillus sp. 3255]MDR6879517.1 sugar phosphate isomerase/epimerase [Bacillus sp. 3255]